MRQTLADPFGVSELEETSLTGSSTPRTILDFDSAVTAPRWGFADVWGYYREASPLHHLVKSQHRMPKTLLLQAEDDPWVPAAAARDLADQIDPSAPISSIFTRTGGHNGFHGLGGCWGDQLAVAWLKSIVNGCGDERSGGRKGTD